MKRITSMTISALIMISIISCATKEKIRTGNGFVNVKGGKIWYNVRGEGDNTPILLLHGGPGFPSHYFNPLRALSKDRPVITFDQLGCGRSDRIADTTLMTVDNYVEQIKQLLTTLNISEFYLYGHSWGTMLGTDYYLKYPEGIKALILASPCLSAPLWVSDADILISTLPDSIQLVLRQSMENLTQDSIKLNSAIAYYFNSFYTRKQPLSADLDSAQLQMGMNVYQYMWGNSEFSATGTLKNYDRTKDLKKIKIPTLYITGEFDAARPATVKYYQTITPNSKLVVINDAGHMTMHDNLEEDLSAINGFLGDLEKN
jgi:proline iminopeptidase